MRLKSLLLSALLLATPVTALADTLYTYTPGANFTNFAQNASTNLYTTSDAVSGSFVLASPLAANLTHTTTVTPKSFSFTDGITTYTDLNSAPASTQFRFKTDASGNITFWDIYATDFLGSPGVLPYNFLETSSSGDYAGVYSASSYYSANNLNHPGTFTVRALAATPEPSSLILLGTGCLAACGTLRRRLASRKA